MNKQLLTLACATLTLAAALPAHAVRVDAAGALPPPTTLIDFEAFDGLLTTGPQDLSGGVTFTGDAGSELGANNRDLGENGLWGAGNRFAAGGLVGELRFTFATLSSGAGAFVNHFATDALGLAVVVSAYGENNQIIETYTVTVATGFDSYDDGVFLGIARSEGDIRSLSFKGVGVVLDDLRVSAVPEPATTALMLGGLGAIGWLARRRRV